MRLLTAHKILIASAIALALLLTARSGWLYAAHRSPVDAGFTVASAMLAIVLARYLRRLFRR